MDSLLHCPSAFAFAQVEPRSYGDRNTPSTSAVVGVVIHRSIELLLRDNVETVDQAWEMACQEQRDSGIEPESRPDARRAKLRLERKMPTLLNFIRARNPTQELIVEEPLSSKDGLIRGQVDLVVIGENPCIIDYKSGLVTEDGYPKEHFVRQLCLYAHLVQDDLGIDIDDAFLFSLREGLWPVDVSSPVRNPIVEESLEAQKLFNSRVPGPQPAFPSVTACSFCRHVGECDEFWGPAGVGGGMEPESGVCVSGHVSARPVISASGVGAISVLVGSTPNDHLLTITDIPNHLVEELEPGDNINCWRLRDSVDSPYVLTWKSGQSGLVRNIENRLG